VAKISSVTAPAGTLPGQPTIAEARVQPFAVHHPDRALERAPLALTQRRRESTTPRKPTIDTEHGQQRDDHAAMLVSQEGRAITRNR
jgi:hypothetical protein